MLIPSQLRDSSCGRHNNTDSGYGTTEKLNLHLLVPATSANPNFCRTTLSAALLDYPTPILINWEGKEDSRNPFASHLAKIESTLAYLRGLPPRNDKDLVLIVDGYDVWFQLRPEVLIQRYYDTIKRNNEKLLELIDGVTLSEHDIRQTVIFGADKKCWPQNRESTVCKSAPESPLQKDIFGPKTDSGNRHAQTRPRWLNSGTILGPAAEVRAIFESTNSRLQDKFHGYSDQWYFAEIFGDQEYQRNSLAKNPRSLKPDRERDLTQIPLSNTKGNQEAEHHMTLDYDASLFHVDAFAKDDTEWVIFNSTDTMGDRLLQLSYDLGRLKEGEIPTLPREISQSRPPVSKDVVEDENYEDSEEIKALPFDTSWDEVPLMVNVITGNVPVIIHLNGNKDMLNQWWQKLWWFRNQWGKSLLRGGSRASRGPLGRTVDPDTGKEITWWKGSYNSLRRENGGYWSAKGQWLFWNDICAPHEKVLFEGDRVKNPRFRYGWRGPPGQRHKMTIQEDKQGPSKGSDSSKDGTAKEQDQTRGSTKADHDYQTNDEHKNGRQGEKSSEKGGNRNDFEENTRRRQKTDDKSSSKQEDSTSKHSGDKKSHTDLKPHEKENKEKVNHQNEDHEKSDKASGKKPSTKEHSHEGHPQSNKNDGHEDSPSGKDNHGNNKSNKQSHQDGRESKNSENSAKSVKNDLKAGLNKDKPKGRLVEEAMKKVRSIHKLIQRDM